MKPTPEILNEAIRRATHGMQNAGDRWAERRERGLDDDQLIDAIKFEFGIMHDAGLREHDRWHYCAQGEFQPKLSVYPGFNSRDAGPPIQGPRDPRPFADPALVRSAANRNVLVGLLRSIR